MPTYEFRCELGHATDQFFGNMSSAPSEIDCPECGARAVRQVSGGIGLLFKGSGFYITDYGKDGKKPRSTEGEGAKTDSGRGEAARESTRNGSADSAKSAGESRAGESRAGESRAGESRGGESRGGESRGGESSDAAKPAPSSKSDSTTSSTKPKGE